MVTGIKVLINLHWPTLYELNNGVYGYVLLTYAADNAYFTYTALTSYPRFHNEMPQNVPHSYVKVVSLPKYDFRLKRLPSPNFIDKWHVKWQDSEK